MLVDAPCSGLGTLRRNPDLKYRQSAETVANLLEQQHSILDAASKLVKPQGRLVYATCSVLPEENEQQVERFLSEHPDFELINCAELLQNLRSIWIPANTCASTPENTKPMVSSPPYCNVRIKVEKGRLNSFQTALSIDFLH